MKSEAKPDVPIFRIRKAFKNKKPLSRKRKPKEFCPKSVRNAKKQTSSRENPLMAAVITKLSGDLQLRKSELGGLALEATLPRTSGEDA